MGIIINGKFYKDGAPKVTKNSITYKSWTHSEQRKNHAKELLQPRDRNGNMNPEFVKAYPEEAKAYGFLPTDEDLKKL